MSKPNFMEKMLDGGEVEWKPFGEVAKIQRGASPRPIAHFITDKEDGVPWIKIGDTSPNSKYVNKTEQRITPEGAMKSRILKKGDFIISNSMSFGRPYILNIDGAIHDGWASISDFGNKLNSDYLYHYLSSNLVQSYWISRINSGSVSNLNSDIIKSLELPIPPIKVQEEIVRILDTFSENTAENTAELTAELTARKKQYTYYRDKLLTFDKGDVEWKTLGEIALIGTGSRNTNESISDGHYPFFVRSQEPRTINEYEFDETAIITAGDGVGVGKVFHFISGKYALHQRAYRIVVTNRGVLSKFLFHFIRNDFARYLTTISVHASVTSLRKPMFERYQIPIPSITEQERIVSILDKFDVLTSSITEGLIREIELRQKQYEYYRNMLLNFPKEEVEA
jgi:type I restriction enzyme S subunit